MAERTWESLTLDEQTAEVRRLTAEEGLSQSQIAKRLGISNPSAIHRFLHGKVKRLPIQQRFWSRVEKTNGCWGWTGETDAQGYARLWSGKKRLFAHRFSYELAVGEIPEGLEVDHLCRNPLCVNPDHLEPVTHAENMRRYGAQRRAGKERAPLRRSAPARPNDHYAPWVLRADLAAVRRSVLRYFQRYERDWERSPVWLEGWHFWGCKPPEEFGAVMTRGRVGIALGGLVRDGLLQRRREPSGRRWYALTDAGREAPSRQSLEAA